MLRSVTIIMSGVLTRRVFDCPPRVRSSDLSLSNGFRPRHNEQRAPGHQSLATQPVSKGVTP